MKLGMRQISIFLIISIILSIFPILQQFSNVSCDLIDESALITHDTIYINGDSQFLSANGVISGTGIKNNPYIIKNWKINASNNHGIWVENTNVFFIIRNCLIYNGTNLNSENHGIYLRNVKNGILENNKLVSNYAGIFFYESDYNKITNCTSNSNDGVGVLIRQSNNNIVINNECNFNLGFGILFDEDSNKNNISINTCNSNSEDGIYFWFSDENKILNNICNSNKNSGILIEEMVEKNEISNNICNFNGYSGISCTDDSNWANIIRNNTCNNNSYNGIIIGGESNKIVNNICNLNKKNGIYSSGTANTIINNICNFNSENGIYLEESSSNIIINNNCSQNKKYGIYIYHSSNYNNVSYNEIFNNSNYGLLCENSRKNIIHHNNFKNNGGEGSQGYDDRLENQWDNGYPSGGNYWSDYSGIDTKKSSNQDQAGSDGIGDTPYSISGSSIHDNYPIIILKFPFAPRNLQAKAGDGYIKLNWSIPDYNGGSNITNYKIYKGITSGNETFLTSINLSLLNYNDTFVINKKQYFYYVTACNIIGESYPSNEVNATPNITSEDSVQKDKKNDSDNDEIPDEWEKNYKFNTTNSSDAQIDPDQDNLTNLEEYLNQTNPKDQDSDNDGLTDGDEIKIYHTNPLILDTDGDNYNDRSEIDNQTNPLNKTDYPKDNISEPEKNNKKNSQERNYMIFMIIGVIIVLILIILAIIVNQKMKKRI